MTLVEDWSNLGTVALPFIVALGLSIGLALALRRAVRGGGSVRAREACVGCEHERGLLRLGRCEQGCAVNDIPALPLLLLVACATFVFLAALFPAIVVTYVVPFAPGNSPAPSVLVLVLLFSAAAGAMALVAYCLQDRASYREYLLWGSGVAVLATLVVGTGSSGVTATVANGLAAAGLGVFLVALAMDWRARQGRPLVGLRAVGAAVVPLFVISVLAAIRIAQILQLSGAV